MRSFLFCIGVLVLGLPCGCSGGAGSGASAVPAVPAPSNLTILGGATPSLFTLHWTIAAGDVDGYILESRIDQGSFSPLNSPSNLIPAKVQSVQITLSESAPDFTDYGFRLKAMQGAASSAYSNEAIFTKPLAAPSGVQAYFKSDLGSVEITWTRNSVKADGVRVERAQADFNGNPVGDWNQIPVPVGTLSSTIDQGVHEFSTYIYRVSNMVGGHLGPASGASNPVKVTMFAPTSVRVDPCPGGLQISWTNRSPSATHFYLTRTPCPIGSPGILATLPAGTSTFRDLAIPTGYYSYTVIASNGSSQAVSPTATGATAPLPGALPLSTRTLSGPRLREVALRPNGSWVELSDSPFGVLSNGDPWPAVFPNDALTQYPGALRVDALGWPHLFYEAADPSDPGMAKLTHLWFDGTRWQTDGVTTARPVMASYRDPGITPALDSSGGVHVLLDLPTPVFPNGGNTRCLSYARKTAGQWTVESLANLPAMIEFEGPYELHIDATGQPHLLVGHSSFFTDFTRATAGAPWTYDLVWKHSTVGTTWCFQSGIWKDPGNACVVFDRMSPGDPLGDYSLIAVQKKGGVWGSETVIGSFYDDANGTRANLARSPDGSRLAVAHSTSSGLKLYVFDGNVWSETLLGPKSIAKPQVAFDAQNKIHVLLREFAQTQFQEWYE